jgi:hypothetical protein
MFSMFLSDVADDEPGEGADDDEADQEGGHREVAGRSC